MVDIKLVAEIEADFERLTIFVYNDRGFKLWSNSYQIKDKLLEAYKKIDIKFLIELKRRERDQSEGGALA